VFICVASGTFRQGNLPAGSVKIGGGFLEYPGEYQLVRMIPLTALLILCVFRMIDSNVTQTVVSFVFVLFFRMSCHSNNHDERWASELLGLLCAGVLGAVRPGYIFRDIIHNSGRLHNLAAAGGLSQIPQTTINY
jgi:hypothetical protein